MEQRSCEYCKNYWKCVKINAIRAFAAGCRQYDTGTEKTISEVKPKK